PAAAAELRQLIETVRARDPGSAFIPTSLAYLGAVYLRAARYEDAVGVLTEAERLNPAGRSYLMPAIHADLGSALLAIGKRDEAATKLEGARAGEGVPKTLTPAQAEAQLGLARVSLSRNDPQSALLHVSAADDFWRDFDPANPARQEVSLWIVKVQQA